jgi:hypothetical protein
MIDVNHNMETGFLKIRHENRGLYGYFTKFEPIIEERITYLEDVKTALQTRKNGLADDNSYITNRISALEWEDEGNV